MEEQFVPYELALLAMKKGFNKPCFAVYQKNKKIWYVKKNDWITNFQINPSPDAIKFQREQYPKNLVLINGVEFMKICYNFTAPLYQQLVDWFREVHNLAILLSIPYDVYWRYSIDGVKGNGFYTNSSYHDKKDFENYYEALNKAIEEAFKLI